MRKGFLFLFLIFVGGLGLFSGSTFADNVCRADGESETPPACLGISKTKKPAELSRHQSVLGKPLKLCSKSPMAGFYRNGFCETGPDDGGLHTVCARVTRRFLDYTRSKGNDLSTPHLEYGFPGLKPGDRWCLCAERWKEANDAGKAPKVILEATHEATLKVVPKDQLNQLREQVGETVKSMVR